MSATTFTMAPSASGDDFRVDRIDVGGGTYVMWPLTKIAIGAMDSDGGPVYSGNPMPSRLYDGSGNAVDIGTSVPSSSARGVVTRPVLSGITASGDALTANPITTGGRASAAVPTTVDDGDAVNDWRSPHGAGNTIIRNTDGDALTIPQWGDSYTGTEKGIIAFGRNDYNDILTPLTTNSTGNLQTVLTHNAALCTPYRTIASTDWSSHKDAIVPQARIFVGMLIYNPNPDPAYIQLFDHTVAASITLGTSVNTIWVPVLANGFTSYTPPQGIPLSNGLVIGQTTTPTGGDGPAANLEVITYLIDYSF